MQFLILIGAVLLLRAVANAELARLRTVRTSLARMETCIDLLEVQILKSPDLAQSPRSAPPFSRRGNSE